MPEQKLFRDESHGMRSTYHFSKSELQTTHEGRHIQIAFFFGRFRNLRAHRLGCRGLRDGARLCRIGKLRGKVSRHRCMRMRFR